MNAKFYNCKRDERYVYKVCADDQTNTEPVDVQILTPANNVIRPQIRLSTGRIGNHTNYVYLSDLNRFYYIKSWTMDNGYITMDLEVDVLMSFRKYLMECPAMIKRNEMHHNRYIPDEQRKIFAATKVKIYGDGSSTGSGWTTPFKRSSNIFYLAVVSSQGADSGGE